jgi:AcrR family transcriptional regulator
MPRPDVSDERRPQIIAAALRVFARDGYHSATMPAIAAEAGLSIGGLYWYYKSKRDVTAAAFAQIFDTDLAAVAALVVSDMPASERLMLLARQIIVTFDTHRDLLPIGVELYGVAVHDAQARGFVQTYLARYRTILAQLIAQGVARGEFHTAHAEDAANILLALVEGCALLWSVDPGGMHYPVTIERGVALLVAGMRNDG